MPKYYVTFGKDYKLCVQAGDAKDAAGKTLRRYIQRNTLFDTNTDENASVVDTYTVPQKFRVSEKGFASYNDENAKEFSHSEITKLIDDGGMGGALEHV